MDNFLVYLLIKKDREKYDFLSRLLSYLHVDGSRYTRYTYPFDINRRRLASKTDEYTSIRVRKKERVVDDFEGEDGEMIELVMPSKMDIAMMFVIAAFIWSPHPKYGILSPRKMTMFDFTSHYPMLYYQEEHMTISKKFVIKINVLGYRSSVEKQAFEGELENLFFYDIVTSFERQIDPELAEEIIIGSFKERLTSCVYGSEKTLRMFFENES